MELSKERIKLGELAIIYLKSLMKSEYFTKAWPCTSEGIKKDILNKLEDTF